jgi:hypothetical protein
MNTCDKCGKCFKIKYYLTQHLKKKIPCDRVIKCDICNKVFTQISNLKSHLNKKNKCKKIDLEEENIKLKEEKKYLEEENLELKLEKLKNNNNIEDKQINKLSNLIISDNKTGYIYLVSNIWYEISDIYKIGRTTSIKSRLSPYNTGRITKDKFIYVYYIETDYPIELEKIIFEYLKDFKLNNEMYKLKLSKLKNIIRMLHTNLINEKNIKKELCL